MKSKLQQEYFSLSEGTFSLDCFDLRNSVCVKVWCFPVAAHMFDLDGRMSQFLKNFLKYVCLRYKPTNLHKLHIILSLYFLFEPPSVHLRHVCFPPRMKCTSVTSISCSSWRPQFYLTVQFLKCKLELKLSVAFSSDQIWRTCNNGQRFERSKISLFLIKWGTKCEMEGKVQLTKWHCSLLPPTGAM